MALRITKEERKEIKDTFVEENEVHIEAYAKIIWDYAESKTLLSEMDLIDSVLGWDCDEHRNTAENILFTLATMEKGRIPLQSLAGAISGMVSAKDHITDRTASMFVAMELLMISEPYCKVTMSHNGHLMIETNISDAELIMKNITLPLTKPTNEHKELGSFLWKLKSDIPALTKLNHVPMLVIPIQDIEPELPSGDRYSTAYLKQDELYKKWEARQHLTPMFENTPIYFNWAADYRVRMYPVGYYFNPQGTELEKNMLGFYNGEKLDFHGIIQMKKSIAAAYGLDKKNDRLKLEWFSKNQHNLEDFYHEAKEKHTYRSLVSAWNNHLNGLEVHHTVGLDASCSQAQIMAVLLKKQEIAVTCNVVNVEDKAGEIQPQDLYQLVANRMSDIIAERK